MSDVYIYRWSTWLHVTVIWWDVLMLMLFCHHFFCIMTNKTIYFPKYNHVRLLISTVFCFWPIFPPQQLRKLCLTFREICSLTTGTAIIEYNSSFDTKFQWTETKYVFWNKNTGCVTDDLSISGYMENGKVLNYCQCKQLQKLCVNEQLQKF